MGASINKGLDSAHHFMHHKGEYVMPKSTICSTYIVSGCCWLALGLRC